MLSEERIIKKILISSLQAAFFLGKRRQYGTKNKQGDPEAHALALELELFTKGSLNTFAQQTNIDTDKRLICYDIMELGEQLRPIGMLVILDSILNRITANRRKGRQTFVYVDEMELRLASRRLSIWLVYAGKIAYTIDVSRYRKCSAEKG